MLAAYEPPPFESGVEQSLRDYIAERKASMEDAWY